VVGIPDNPKFSVTCLGCGSLVLGINPVTGITWRPPIPPPAWMKPAGVWTIIVGGWIGLLIPLFLFALPLGIY
jgi:hypothetical protein